MEKAEWHIFTIGDFPLELKKVQALLAALNERSGEVQ